MLLKRDILERIKAGQVRLVFRRWRRPTVRAGGTLHTAAGILAIESIAPIAIAAISTQDAEDAGYASPEALRKAIDGTREGEVYRIELHWAGDDPRIALRDEVDLGAESLERLRETLAKMDSRSRTGSWTANVLRLIADREGVPAAELAHRLGLEKLDLKRRIRSLKALGLTESLAIGYRLSPRGRAFLQSLRS